MSASEKGRHAELLAMAALMANGWTVSEPTLPEAFDLSIKRNGDKQTFYVQVKTASLRDEERYNGEWVITKGAKSNGTPYSKDEVDYFIAIFQGEVYMFPNLVQREYWVRPWELSESWTKLNIGIHAETTKSEAV